ncbi:energy transducer TonB family protein [Geomesophilobacter sediminis]|uniref:Energy transducer TonB n=1 Tax=Geomesophilobacter sediminis TaxID=2798584 RepID=A0A8J7JL37_9BACT|nr:energy transducer TonB [Geomesophilobacter sediminis]MBJ6725100.1 energy transducer TonB [Geomesophilobacter sediminis]
MSDKHIEKSLLYLVFLSIVLHVAAYSVFSLLPPEKPKVPKDATMIELTDLPPPLPNAKDLKAKEQPKPKPEPKPEPPKPKPKPKPEPPPKPKVLPKPEPPKPLPKPLPLPKPVTLPKPQAVKPPPPLVRPKPPAPQRTLPPQKQLPQSTREAAPKAFNKSERTVESKNAPNVRGKTEAPKAARTPGRSDSPFRMSENGGKEISRGEGLLRPQRGEQRELAKLFPSARHLANLEEGYRKRYEEAEQGDTRLMDTDDPTIGTFAYRFRNLLRDRLNAITPWNLGIGKGITILTITFNREGNVVDIRQLESSGNRVLDELAATASRTAGYPGPLPRKWEHDQLNLIFVFRVGEGGVITNRWE